ncbi:hypothetical protein Rs2_17770 [Raphanus sativus]|uniref:Uncharacterized protein LOC108854047 n=1 Tax=Raphanus sativus TaxID=3726 RepID=A0A6J0NGS9_RAPSA|nr:uncharacterized protein LOC108854047 [Raphanus sativus]XP_018483039.1 uncharacterized protein LOC108854047 [Raphanus sativus]XP_056863333.1 uncharacterized protein LOC108854047 [Raphanus sativus]KAJ4903819.1 hypothetical protein Rs2_17770 [Raphanus sativus]
MRQQRASEDRYLSSHPHGTLEHRGKDELVKRDMLDPPRYLRRTEATRGKALSFGVLDWQQLEKRKDSASERTKEACCSYASSYTGSLELDLATGVVKRLELDGKQDDVQCESSSPVNVREQNQHSLEKPCLSNKGRHASPNPRFSFSFSQMRRSFSTKETSSSGSTLSSTSHASAKSGPLTFNDSAITKPKNGHSRTRSGPVKTDKNVPLQVASKPPTTEKKSHCSSRSHALLQFTLRKGISLYQFVVDNNTNNNVLAATMKSSDSSRRSYTLYSIKEVKNKSGNWLSRSRNDHPFVHTIIGQMKTNFDSATHKTESVLFGVETNEELAAAVVQTRNRTQKQDTTTVMLPGGSHTLPKDCNAPLPLIDRWKAGGKCDCGGWDIGCKLRVLSSNHHTKSESFSSFQLFGQERDEPVFKMVTHDDELHSVEFGSSVSLLEAFFIALAVSSHQNWCEEEEEEEAVLIGGGTLKRVASTKYASNPPVSPIGRV